MESSSKHITEKVSLSHSLVDSLYSSCQLSIYFLRNFNFKSTKYFAGHSLGEYSALVSAKSLTFEDALILVSSRAKFMQEAIPEGEGAIAAIIGLTYEDLNSICLSICHEGLLVELANINSSNQIVISGAKKAVDKAIERGTEAGAKRAVLLPMSVPAHCELMKPASERFEKILNSINIQCRCFYN